MAAFTGAALLGAAAIGGGASLLATNKAVKAQNNATKANQAAATSAIANNNAAVDKATGLITDAFNTANKNTQQATANVQPWKEVGMSGLAALASAYGLQLPDELKGLAPAGAFGGFFESPEYKLRMQQGAKAITAQAASRGLLDSGATGKALVRFGQNEAGAGFQQFLGNLMGVVGLGQTATNQENNLLLGQGNLASQYGSNIANLVTGNAANNSGIMLNQGQVAGQGAANVGNLQSGLIANLGGIGAGLIQNWPGSGGGMPTPSVPQVGVGAADFMRDWRLSA